MNACAGNLKPRKENALNILRFQTNTPTEVALNSPQGTIVEGRYWERVLFHLTDGRVMYVPPIVAARLNPRASPRVNPSNSAKPRSKTADCGPLNGG